MQSIEQAISVAGGVKALASAIGVPAQSVYFWRDGKRRIPAEYCPSIEELTGLPCEAMRPDVKWYVLRGKASEEKCQLALDAQALAAIDLQGV